MDKNTVLPSVTNEKANGKRKGVKLAIPNQRRPNRNEKGVNSQFLKQVNCGSKHDNLTNNY